MTLTNREKVIIMKGLTYIQATITLPGSLDTTLLGKPAEVVHDRVRFTYRNDFYVEARITPFYLPTGLSDHPLVAEQVTSPTRNLVSGDLDTLEDLWSRFESVKRAGPSVTQSLSFDRSSEGNLFKVYDYSGNREIRLGQQLLRFKGVDRAVIEPSNQDLVDLAQHLYQEPLEGHPGQFKFLHMQGTTLREAVERILQMYSHAGRLFAMKGVEAKVL